MKRYPYSRHKPCTATMQAHRDGPSAHKQDTSDDSSSANYIPTPASTNFTPPAGSHMKRLMMLEDGAGRGGGLGAGGGGHCKKVKAN